MYLLSICFILSFLSVNTTVIAYPFLKWISRQSANELSLKSKKLDLIRQQTAVSMVDNFAKYSKIQRKINVIDQELEEIRSQKNQSLFFTRTIAIFGLKIIITFILIFLSYYYRHFPVLFLDKKYNLFPFSNIIAYPNEVNTVSVHIWILCCTVVARIIKKTYIIK